MTQWHFHTPDVQQEAPFSWSSALMERYGMDRGVTVYQTAPGANYATKRFGSFTDENGSLNVPANEPGTPLSGLNTFRGGYDWIVGDQDRSDMIASGVVSQVNFHPVDTPDLALMPTAQFNTVNLYNNTVSQDLAVDNVNNFIYTTQLMQGGIQLPGEGAPVSGATRSANGDIAVTRLDMNGRFLAGMYVRGAGHGIGLGVEHTGGSTYLWFGSSSSGGFSTAVTRTQFVANGVFDSVNLPILTPFAPPNNTGVSCAIDSTNRRIAVRRTFPAGDPNGRELNLYDLDAVISTNTWTPLYTFNQNTFPVPGPGQVGTFQGMGTYGNYCYTTDGTSGTNNVYLTSVDWTTGVTTQRALVTWLSDTLTFREPEGCEVWVPDPNTPDRFRVCFLFADGIAGGRNATMGFVETVPT